MGVRGGNGDASVRFAAGPGISVPVGAEADGNGLLGSRGGAIGPTGGPNPLKSVPEGSLSLSGLDRAVNSVSIWATARSSDCASRSIASSGTGGSRLRN
jgi:hypothetical protein